MMYLIGSGYISHQVEQRPMKNNFRMLEYENYNIEATQQFRVTDREYR